MRTSNRRQFIQRTAGSLNALCACPLTARSDCTQSLEQGTQQSHSYDAAVIRALAAKIEGRVMTPDEDDYETARLIFNRAFDRHPAVIVYCVSASDVARVLEFAQRRTLPVAVRGGGHSAGCSTCDDRLATIKKKYDPENVLRMNQDIDPS